jgi:hypothetical protein
VLDSIHSFVRDLRVQFRRVRSCVQSFSHKRIQKLSVQLWSVNQWTMDTEEVTDF